MRLFELFEKSGTTVAVAFGRMNPPTIGHEKLVDAILKQPADDHFLFVSHTSKTTGKSDIRFKNPIPFDIKLGFIQQAFPNIEIGDTSVTTVIQLMKHLESQGYDNVIFVCGSDRVPEFNQLLNAQNGVDYNIKNLKIESSGARDPDSEGAEGMSGTKLRQAAIDNDLEKFRSGLASGLQANAEEVFAAVRQGLEPWIEKAPEAVKEFSPAGGDGGNNYGGDLHDILMDTIHQRYPQIIKQFGLDAVDSTVSNMVVMGTFDDIDPNEEDDLEDAVAEIYGVLEDESTEESIKEGYGRYWCSTDKKWKYRKGPKQSRKS